MKRIIYFLPIYFLLLICLNTSAQDLQDDFSPYLAKTFRKALLKFDADSLSKTKLILPIGSQLYVFSKNDIDGYLKVIDIRTNKLGFVRKSTLKKIKDLPLSQSNSFQENGQSSSTEPEVEITNESSKTITLIVGSKYFSLSPHTASPETIESGNLNYTASAPSVIPLSGTHYFKSGDKYTWTFSIETSYK